MQEIKVGEYVRTKNGDIGKVKFLSDTTADIGKKYIFKKDIVKQSKNPIDLIEVGDYVNGFLVEDIIIENEIKKIKLTDERLLENKDIRTIITREQIEKAKSRLEN